MKAVAGMIVGAAAVLSANVARAQEGQLTTEVRCLAAIVMAKKLVKDPEQQSTMTTMAIHFHGRVDVRDPTLDIPAAMKDAVPSIEKIGLAKVYSDCTTSFGAKMKSFANALTNAP